MQRFKRNINKLNYFKEILYELLNNHPDFLIDYWLRKILGIPFESWINKEIELQSIPQKISYKYRKHFSGKTCISMGDPEFLAIRFQDECWTIYNAEKGAYNYSLSEILKLAYSQFSKDNEIKEHRVPSFLYIETLDNEKTLIYFKKKKYIKNEYITNPLEVYMFILNSPFLESYVRISKNFKFKIIGVALYGGDMIIRTEFSEEGDPAIRFFESKDRLKELLKDLLKNQSTTAANNILSFLQKITQSKTMTFRDISEILIKEYDRLNLLERGRLKEVFKSYGENSIHYILYNLSLELDLEDLEDKTFFQGFLVKTLSVNLEEGKLMLKKLQSSA
ncbi:hypothetical protein AB834_05390 [PVC group bacterium (ex Bugula neritina AB1)]|nr:hypothetical protein AB834_05390 [PVC group bacterium (ex Bugula neritina AB1)]